MATIMITEAQYNRLIFNEFKANLYYLAERKESIKQIVNEGSRDLILGAALILAKATGKSMSNFNQVVATKALSNIRTMSNIKSTIEDEIKLNELVDEFKNIGIKNSQARMAINSHKFVDTFNSMAKEMKMDLFLDTNAINNLRQLKPKKSNG